MSKKNLELTLANLKRVKSLVFDGNKGIVEFGIDDVSTDDKDCCIINRGPAGVGQSTEFHCDGRNSAITIMELIEVVTGHKFSRIEVTTSRMDVFVRDDHPQNPWQIAATDLLPAP